MIVFPAISSISYRLWFDITGIHPLPDSTFHNTFFQVIPPPPNGLSSMLIIVDHNI